MKQTTFVSAVWVSVGHLLGSGVGCDPLGSEEVRRHLSLHQQMLNKGNSFERRKIRCSSSSVSSIHTSTLQGPSQLCSSFSRIQNR